MEITAVEEKLFQFIKECLTGIPYVQRQDFAQCQFYSFYFTIFTQHKGKDLNL